MTTETTEYEDQIPAWLDWLPLLLLPVSALAVQVNLPAWVFMWAMALAIYFGCKWITWQRARRNGCEARAFRSLGYFLFWPGMDAPAFLSSIPGTRSLAGKWMLAVMKIGVGAALFSFAARRSVEAGTLVTGWLAMLGLVLMLHFGIFELLALVWQRAGVQAQPVMDAPLLSTSLKEFWGQRWNTAFHALASDLAFRPLARLWGANRATLGVFAISGLVHELVISFPARAGYGLPTAYFLLQGLAVLLERSAFGRRFGLGKGWRGWFFTLACTAGPAFWLFHPAFIRNVILPMLRAFGPN